MDRAAGVLEELICVCNRKIFLSEFYSVTAKTKTLLGCGIFYDYCTIIFAHICVVLRSFHAWAVIAAIMARSLSYTT